MDVKISWSDEAIKTYEENIRYLVKEWSEKEIKGFEIKLEYILFRLAEHPESFNPSQKNKKVRRARINKYITIYYRYYPIRKEIVLLSFWNTKQNPGKLRF